MEMVAAAAAANNSPMARKIADKSSLRLCIRSAETIEISGARQPFSNHVLE